MTRKASLVLVAVALALAVASLQAQDPDGGRGGRFGGQGPLIDPSQLPPAPGGRGGRIGGPLRDNVQPVKGTSKISGRVVSADTGNPIRRAQVRVNAPDVRVNRVATTDNQGHFEVAELPAARYRLQISKAGYVTLEYGQARPFEAGKPLDLADGQLLDKIDFSLPRGSVIAGRITDEFGEPIADAQVQAMRYQFASGQRQLVNAGRTAISDDVGQFRIFGLMPGEYIVRASVRDAGAMAAAVMAAEEPSGYPTTYYPGTTDVGQAQSVAVALGQELGSVMFSLVPARLARVSGNVLSSSGRPLGGAVVVMRPATGGAVGPFNIGGANQVGADGSFTLNNVPPGDYTLDVQQRPRDLQTMAGGELEFASIPLSVSGEDIKGLTILTTPGISISGRVAFEGQKSQTISTRGVQVMVAPVSGQQSIMGMAGRALGGGRVGDDGTFELRGVLGPQIIRVSGIPAGWALKSIALNGQDITDSGYDFKPGNSVTGVVVTLTDRVTDLSGSVRDVKGLAVKDYVLVVFPTDSRLLGGQSRYVRTARPNQEGTFNLKGLPPGQYLASAIESLENGAQNDPAVLNQLRPRARSFSLGEGQALSLTVDITP
ncbi:MAG: carboxypeptidase-like regulatory domain-containing protein [Vicinamibacterales bacterium]|nr:carboxypeptidase-like regulatory domain-containing protein [Vicinamibacterales bacterium]